MKKHEPYLTRLGRKPAWVRAIVWVFLWWLLLFLYVAGQLKRAEFPSAIRWVINIPLAIFLAWSALTVNVIVLLTIIDGPPANRVEYRILNDSNQTVILKNLPCGDFCSEYEEIARLAPGQSYKRVMVPLTDNTNYELYSVDGRLMGCVDLEQYYERSKTQTTIGTSAAIPCKSGI